MIKILYKPSNLSPNLKEVDGTLASKDFYALVNSTGSSVKSYKLGLLNNNGDTEIYQTDKVFTDGNKINKSILTMPFPLSTAGVVNGKDYQWWVRMYDSTYTRDPQNPSAARPRPDTKVCSGYLVGSTTYVVWTNNNEKLKTDRWIEFNTTGPDSMLPIIPPNTDNKKLPDAGEKYRQRLQIDWLEKELGWDKNITKLELNDQFYYNYKNGTPFTIYQCSDLHTLTSVFVDPNDKIERSYYIVLFDTEENAQAAHAAGYLPTSAAPTGLIETYRKIIGYGEETGEIRVQEAFSKIPENGNAYLLFERVIKTYTSTSSSSTTTTDTETLVSTTTTSGNDTTSTSTTNYEWKEVTSTVSQVVGGAPINDSSFKTITNDYSSTQYSHIFITPVEPSSVTVIGNYIKFYDEESAEISGAQHKVENYNETTGEMIFKSSEITAPSTGNTYKLFSDDTYETEITDITSSQTVTNVTTNTEVIQQLFIQPNINILTDDTNPDEIEFGNGVRVLIIKTLSTSGLYVAEKQSDITFDKLDNSQWMLKYMYIINGSAADLPLTPKTTYNVYTDFMDSMPNAIFYARSTPSLTLQYKGVSDDSFINIESTTPVTFRDITFNTVWQQSEDVLIKYYHYYLYDYKNNLIGESEDVYSSEVQWGFRGLSTSEGGMKYTVKVTITDEFGSVFETQSDFLIQYTITTEIIELETYYNCESQSIHITANAPVYVRSENEGTKTTVTTANISGGKLAIGPNEVLNYTKIIGNDEYMEIPNNYSFMTKIGIPSNYFSAIPDGDLTRLFDVNYRTDDNSDPDNPEYSNIQLRLGGINQLYLQNGLIQENGNFVRLSLYKDGTELTQCFKTEQGLSDDINLKNLISNDTHKTLYTTNSFVNALLPTTGASKYYILVIDFDVEHKIFDVENNVGALYVLIKGTTFNAKLYLPGVYYFEEAEGDPQYYTNSKYLFLEDTLNKTYSSLEVDTGLRASSGESGNIYFEGQTEPAKEYLWIENENLIKTLNDKILNEIQFVIYLIVDTSSGEEKITCEVHAVVK